MVMILSNLNRIFKVFSLQDSLVNLQLRVKGFAYVATLPCETLLSENM